MNPRTTLYLLFREYVDAQTLPSRIYIHCRVFDIEKLEEEIQSEVRPLLSIVRFFNYENLIVLYDRKNLDALLYPVKTFPKEYPGLDTAILAQLQGVCTTWDSCPMVTDKLSYTLEMGCDISKDMLGDMTRRQHHCFSPCALLQRNAIDTNREGRVKVICSDHSIEQLSTFNNVRGFHEWISENRIPKREYHFSSKHGDANNQSQSIDDGHCRRATQLLTDNTTTNKLLKYAVGRNKESELWYYDVDNRCFIYFENEGNTPQHGFHAYHLHPGEENFDNIDVDKLRQVQDNIPF